MVGEVGHFWLVFSEAEHDEPDATEITVQARAEPLGTGRPSRGGMMWDGTVRDDPPIWPTTPHGNGLECELVGLGARGGPGPAARHAGRRPGRQRPGPACAAG